MCLWRVCKRRTKGRSSPCWRTVLGVRSERLGLLPEPGQRNEGYHKSLVRGCPGQLLAEMIVWIGPDKGKEVLRVWL